MTRRLCPKCELPLCLAKLLRAPIPTTAKRSTRTIGSRSVTTTATQPSKASSPRELLSRPTWSVASLLEAQSSQPPLANTAEHETSASPTPTGDNINDEITVRKLHHLLRLSALPLPPTPEAESSLLAALHSHNRFVRAFRAVDTTAVEPLRALRDETTQGREEIAVGLADLQHTLAQELHFGHRKRPRRDKSSKDVDPKSKAAEDWRPLATAGRTAGKFFVVQSKKNED